MSSVPVPEGLSAIEHRNFVADNFRFSDKTGWRPEIALEQGIVNTVNCYLEGQSS